MTQRMQEKPPTPRILERKILYSRLVLAVERLWPRLWLPIGVLGVFVLVSLTGIWPSLPLWAHKLALALFGLFLIASLGPLLLFRWPTREDALKRLEQVSGLKHQPLSSFEDNLGTQNPSRTTMQLWQAHLERITKTFSKLKTGRPRPRVDRWDPFALRALLIIVLFVGILATGNLVSDRISSAFRVNGTVDTSNIRLDAWITPPQYTGKASVILSDGSKPFQEAGKKHFVKVPQNSMLVIRINSKSSRSYKVLKSAKISYGIAQQGSYQTVKAQPNDNKNKNIMLYRVPLKAAHSIKIRNGLQDIHQWQIFIQKDNAPEIKLLRPIRKTSRDAILLRYQLTDDYGVKTAKARFTRPGSKPKDLKNPNRPLGKPPEFALLIPRNSTERGIGQTYKDLTSHPWAGLEVTLVLSAVDEAGQVSQTKPVKTILPARRFTKPLAKALIEQRRKLVDKPITNFFTVMRTLHALTIAPERYSKDLKVYLGIRTAFYRMRYNVSRATAQSVVDQLWEIALYIEDGNISDAERRLRQAQDKLAKALRDGASGDEIRKLLDELRRAVANFSQSLARQQRNQPIPRSLKGRGTQQVISQEDLDRMLKEIEQLAKSGSRQMAAQMLNRLRNVLENLQNNTARNNQSNRQLLDSMDQLNKIISGQQKLLDQTFSERRRAQNNGSRQGKPGKNGKSKALAGQQGQLRQMLNQLMQGMRGRGVNPGKPFDQAGGAMGEATQSLNQRDLDRATQQQTLALDKLRSGAQNLARQLMRQLGNQRGRMQGQRDPFGRRMSPSRVEFGNSTVKVPDKIDVQRAREILRELRKRYGDSYRPPIELDYLERLLKQF